MKNTVFACLFLLFLPIFSFCQSAKEKGLNFIEAVFDKKLAEAEKYVDETVKPYVTPQALSSLGDAAFEQYGNYIRNIEINEVNTNGKTIYYYSEFQQAMLDIKIEFAANDKVTSLVLTEHRSFRRDHYFREEELSISSGSITVPGSLLLPEPYPGKYLAILLHDGYGATNRDGAINKYLYLKDIAEGLYRKGIATFRFDKRSSVSPDEYEVGSYSIDVDVVNDALSIVRYFKASSRFKDYKLVLIGHGLGGALLPLLVDSLKGQVDRIVLVAANARPWDEVLLNQYKYFYSANPTSELKGQIETLETRISFLRSDRFTASSPKEELPFGFTAAYWGSLLRYNQLEAIKKIKIPSLILQGERDFRVTNEDYTLWQSTLKNDKNAAFKSYPLLNHYFIEGKKGEKSMPGEYYLTGHVPDYVMKDISSWIVSGVLK